MFQVQPTKTDSSEFSRCDGSEQLTDHGEPRSPAQASDAAIKENIYHAFWKEDVLRALEYFEIDVHVKNGIVYLNGHILSRASQGRVESAMQNIPGILGVINDLVLDDNLTLEVATSLGALEHTYDCKFFTGASHGVVSLNGKVKNKNIKLLAEQCASANPNVRGVIDNIQIPGIKMESKKQPFLQPAIGVTIYFQDGISGVVKQVAINPNNRRVTAMILLGHFDNQEQDLQTMNNGEARQPAQRIVVSMDTVRFLTKSSGFLHIRSYESTRYMDFDPDAFIAPDLAWKPPYPYCPNDILFPIQYRDTAIQIAKDSMLFPLAGISADGSQVEESHVNDSPGK
jgi:hypothetical protein